MASFGISWCIAYLTSSMVSRIGNWRLRIIPCTIVGIQAMVLPADPWRCTLGPRPSALTSMCFFSDLDCNIPYRCNTCISTASESTNDSSTLPVLGLRCPCPLVSFSFSVPSWLASSSSSVWPDSRVLPSFDCPSWETSLSVVIPWGILPICSSRSFSLSIPCELLSPCSPFELASFIFSCSVLVSSDVLWSDGSCASPSWDVGGVTRFFIFCGNVQGSTVSTSVGSTNWWPFSLAKPMAAFSKIYSMPIKEILNFSTRLEIYVYMLSCTVGIPGASINFPLERIGSSLWFSKATIIFPSGKICSSL